MIYPGKDGMGWQKDFIGLLKNGVQFKTFKVEPERVDYGLDLECGENMCRG